MSEESNYIPYPPVLVTVLLMAGIPLLVLSIVNEMVVRMAVDTGVARLYQPIFDSPKMYLFGFHVFGPTGLAAIGGAVVALRGEYHRIMDFVVASVLSLPVLAGIGAIVSLPYLLLENPYPVRINYPMLSIRLAIFGAMAALGARLIWGLLSKKGQLKKAAITLTGLVIVLWLSNLLPSSTLSIDPLYAASDALQVATGLPALAPPPPPPSFVFVAVSAFKHLLWQAWFSLPYIGPILVGLYYVVRVRDRALFGEAPTRSSTT